MKKLFIFLSIIFICYPALSAKFLYKDVCLDGQGDAGGNCDYTTLETCMNANEQDLTGDGWFDVEIKGEWATADTSSVTIHNYTTTATDYINIYTTAAARHDGKWDTGAYRIEYNTTAQISITVAYLTLDGLQVKDTSGSSGENVIDEFIDASTGHYTIKNCIIFASSASSAGDGIYLHGNGTNVVVDIYNNVIFASTGAALGIRGGGTSGYTLNVYNNVIANFSTGILAANSSTLNITNNYVSSTTCYSGTMNKTTTASSDATGSAGLQNIAYSTSSGAYFTNVTLGSEDFHITNTSSDLYQAGTDLSSIFTDDIDGDTRTGTWDIGADEYASSAVAHTQTILFN